MPASATAAVDFAVCSQPVTKLKDRLKVNAAPFFAIYKARELEIIEPRALQIYCSILDMYAHCRANHHRLYRIDPSEITKAIGSEKYRIDPRPNQTAIRRLFALGFLNKTATGIRPAESLDKLKIDSRQIDAIKTWINENKLGRATVLIPKNLLAEMPGFSHGQIAVALELIRRATWKGDASETTATTWLRIPEIVSRWGISRRTVQNVLHGKKGLGENVRFELLGTHSFQRQKFGNRYRIIIAPPSVASVSLPDNEKPIRITTSIPPKVNKCTPYESAEIFAPHPPESAEIFAPPDLVCNSLRVYKNHSYKKAQPQDQNQGMGVSQSQAPEKDSYDFDLSADSTIAPLIAPAQIQEGLHAADTAEGIAPVAPAPCPATALAEDQGSPYGFDLATTSALVIAPMAAVDPADDTARPVALEDLPSADFTTHGHTADDMLLSPPVILAALATNGPTPADTASMRPSVDDQAADPVVAPALVVDPDPSTPAALVTGGKPRPDWDRLIECDLADSARLDPLYQQVIARKILRRSQSTRLNFWTAAAHAVRVGKSPPALFRFLIEEGHWETLTDEDEDIARDMLRRHDHRPPAALRMVPKPTPPPALSEDARTVANVRRWQRAERPWDDPLQAFKKCFVEGKDWTRARWEAACQELNTRGLEDCG